MKFSTALLSTVLLATSALAAPRGSSVSQRMARRNALRNRAGNLMIPLGAPEQLSSVEAEDKNATHVQYSSNWSGAVLESPPAQATFTAVSATFTVPVPTGSAGQAAAAWVGIDGDTYTKAILQTGVDFSIGDSGKPEYDAWYEWYPDVSHDFSGITFKGGDKVFVSVVSSSSSKGVATIKNLSSGKTVTKTIEAPSSGAKLGGQNAEWIVEDFEEGSSLVPLVDFGTVKFTGAVAVTEGGDSVDTTGATIIDIRSGSSDKGPVVTDVTASGSTVTVKYTGSDDE